MTDSGDMKSWHEEWQEYTKEAQRQRGELLRRMFQIVGPMPADLACKDQRGELLQQLIQAAAVIQRNTDRRKKIQFPPTQPGRLRVTYKKEEVQMAKMTGGQALVRSLYREGVRVVFGLPGVQLYHAMDAFYDEPGIRFITTRHEQATAYMADGYSRAGGRHRHCAGCSRVPGCSTPPLP